MTYKEAITVLSMVNCHTSLAQETIELAIKALKEADMRSTENDLYREETCERKAHCYDYKYWHCIGCKNCKDYKEVKENE